MTTLLIALLALAAPTTRESRLDIATKLWEQRLAAAAGKHVVAEHYPTEEALVFLSAYSVTRDERYAKQAVIQLDYCHTRETDGLFLTSDGTTTRDYQARHIYNFYLAYRVLGDRRYLQWADASAAAMLRVIPRAKHRGFETFEAGFFNVKGERAGWTKQYVDPNQNAEVALAFSLLYHDKASKFVRNPLAKEIAYQELLASMSIQDMQTGLIALTEDIPGGDTLYGSYAAFSWVWCQLLWRDEKFEPHIQAAGRWLGPMTDLLHASQRFYPIRIDGGVVSDWEASYRLPLLWHCRIESRRFITDLFARASDLKSAPSSWAYFDLMGIPREFYIDGQLPR